MGVYVMRQDDAGSPGSDGASPYPELLLTCAEGYPRRPVNLPL
jgi:hypothetical protein